MQAFILKKYIGFRSLKLDRLLAIVKFKVETNNELVFDFSNKNPVCGLSKH